MLPSSPGPKPVSATRFPGRPKGRYSLHKHARSTGRLTQLLRVSWGDKLLFDSQIRLWHGQQACFFPLDQRASGAARYKPERAGFWKEPQGRPFPPQRVPVFLGYDHFTSTGSREQGSCWATRLAFPPTRHAARQGVRTKAAHAGWRSARGVAGLPKVQPMYFSPTSAREQACRTAPGCLCAAGCQLGGGPRDTTYRGSQTRQGVTQLRISQARSGYWRTRRRTQRALRRLTVPHLAVTCSGRDSPVAYSVAWAGQICSGWIAL